MKLRSILMMTVAALAMTACDDDRETSLPGVAGTYRGYTLAGCAYFSDTCTADETVVVTENGDGTARVSFVSGSWGEFTIPAARIASEGGAAALTGSGKAQMGMSGNIASYDCTFTARIHASDEAQMRFEVPAVMGGLTVDFATGEAPVHLLLAGNYEGYSDADCAYFTDNFTDGERFCLTAGEGGTLGLRFESATWGTFSVAEVRVERGPEGYGLAGEGTVSMGMGGASNDYPFTMTGRIGSDKRQFSVVFSVPAVMGGLTVTLLPGSAPEVSAATVSK